MKAADVMVTNVITIGPDTRVEEIARILLANRISAVPVVDDGKLIGIVSEGDLMRRPEAGTERARSWWLAALTNTRTLADEFVRTHSRRAGDVMTRMVVTAKPDTSLADVASLLERNRIKRVPIVEDGRVVGIVSRANLLQALASRAADADLTPAVGDATLRGRVMAQLTAAPRVQPALFNVIIRDGAVDLWGSVDSEAERKAIRVAAELTPGVRSVNDHLVVQPTMVSGC